MRFAFVNILFVLIFILKIINVNAQSFPLRSYSVDDGLISNIVYDAEQDDKGIIWFSTSAGISKYDGKELN